MKQMLFGGCNFSDRRGLMAIVFDFLEQQAYKESFLPRASLNSLLFNPPSLKLLASSLSISPPFRINWSDSATSSFVSGLSFDSYVSAAFLSLTS